MGKTLFFYLFKVLPKRGLSRLVGRLMALEKPRWLARLLLWSFARYYKINMDEAELPLSSYPSVARLFTRRLRSGVRPLGDLEPLHPADGALNEWGKVEKGQAYQIKGMAYSLEKLLQDPSWAQELEGGVYATYYLCPTDYHRVHFPVSGQVARALHVAGQLWPVNALSVQAVQELFAINERVVVEILTDRGRVALVMVGATNVGKMTMSFDRRLVTNQPQDQPGQVAKHSYWPPIQVKAGDECGTFHMGSTVVMVYPKSFFSPEGQQVPSESQIVGGHRWPGFVSGPVRMGERALKS